jgi:hypothetical protein
MSDIDISNMDMSDFKFEDIEKVFYCGLLSDAKENNETLKLEDMEDLLDQEILKNYLRRCKKRLKSHSGKRLLR